jgi:nitroreductase
MDLPVDRWFRSIPVRISRRAYSPLLPEEDKLARLGQVCREFRPFPEVRSELVAQRPEDEFKGLVGGYGRVTGAPAYIAFIGRMNSARVQEAAGYTGEGIILEATALGLSTCWVGGFGRVEMRNEERVLSITPVGYAPREKTRQEKIMSGVVGSGRRKPLSALLAGRIDAPWMGAALEAARLAPSARNRQPWRFRIERGAVVVAAHGPFSPSTISKRLDCGICMLHFELGARAYGVAGKWEILPSPDVARFVF